MTKLVMDAYAWIEYFEGSRQGKKVQDLIQEGNEILTHTLTVAEVASKISRKGKDGTAAYHALHALTKIITTNDDFSRDAGLLHAHLRQRIDHFGLADAFVLLLARQQNAKVVTGDPHFKGMDNVIFLN